MRRAAAGALLCLALASCGGGGGGSSSLPAASGSLPTPTPAPTPTPTAAPAPMADVRGVAVDDANGQPIAGARVIVSENTVIAGPTPPPAASPSWPSATTAPDGSFDVKNVPPSAWTLDFAYVGAGYPRYANAQWVQIFPVDGHAAYHGIWSVAPNGTTDLGSVAIAQPNAQETAWLARVNADRATVGLPAVATPLSFDSVTLQTARYWAQQSASLGFYAHQCPAGTACVPFWLWETQHHSMPSSQNLDYGAVATWTWQNAEGAFMAEIANCPNGGNWQMCPYAENTGHYIDIMSASYWAGVAIAVGKDPTSQSGSTTPYYVQNFSSPSNNVSAIQSLRRSLGL